MFFLKPKVIFSIIAIIVLIYVFDNMWVNLNVHQIMCIQAPISGKLHWYTDAGLRSKHLEK